MSYVPIVPHTPQPPSSNTRELATQLARVMVEFEEAHPSMTKSEVRQALHLALNATSASNAVAGPVIAMTLGVVLLAVGAAFFLAQGGAGSLGEVPWLMVAMVAVLVVGGLLAFLARRDP